MTSGNSSSPDGLIWDGDNYSCAYDALLRILYEVWSTVTNVWTRRFKKNNQCHLKSVSPCFKKYMNGQASFETARDTISNKLHPQNLSENTLYDHHNMVPYISIRFNDTIYQLQIYMIYQVSASDH